MSDLQNAIDTWKQHEAKISQIESEYHTLKANLEEQKSKAGTASAKMSFAERDLSNALTMDEMNQQREKLEQAKKDCDCATKLKDNLERAVERKPDEIKAARESAHKAYKEIWKLKLAELEAQLPRGLIIKLVVASKQADEGAGIHHIVQRAIGGEILYPEMEGVTEQLSQDMGLS